MRISRAIVLALSCAGAACGGGGDSTIAPDDQMAIAAFAGTGQTAIVGHAVTDPPAVRVTNHFGLPLEGITIKFIVTAGNGVIDGDTQLTNSSGIARPRSWTLGSVAKVDSLEARAVTSTGGAIDAVPVKFTATAVQQ